MTDDQMLAHATKIWRFDWQQVARYEEQAKDPFVKERLQALRICGYHHEEARAGLN